MADPDTPTRALAQRIARSISGVVTGKAEAAESAILTLLAGGHLLIEDVPGVGKTTLASVLSRAISADSHRIQFTSDMLPTDVTGLSIFDQESHAFTFHPGPIFTNIVIGDEVNRATPRTQSALLEAMAERSVTVDGRTHGLPDLFMVVATQNPQDMAGTFPLPEAQRDRFMTQISIGYPDAAAERAMLANRGASDPLDAVSPVATVADVLRARQEVAGLHLSDPVQEYLVAVVGGTRRHEGISLGGSPRATLHLARMARARAAIRGRDFVSPDDVAALAGIVLPHRLVPRGRFESVAASMDAASQFVAEIIARTPVP
ncbi:MoxR family ATPase [Leucobacter tardus]|uniref:MoxR family ATPase n=1 Tax=Leucobacter tardus TaxID=501483 RepID=A0A939QED4_9MICO|nr:MoxR family ATPase [Leucobacter tardus]MBO2990277.1 MoxR family ATPase [Leucobacter tardus]